MSSVTASTSPALASNATPVLEPVRRDSTPQSAPVPVIEANNTAITPPPPLTTKTTSVLTSADLAAASPTAATAATVTAVRAEPIFFLRFRESDEILSKLQQLHFSGVNEADRKKLFENLSMQLSQTTKDLSELTPIIQAQLKGLNNTEYLQTHLTACLTDQCAERIQYHITPPPGGLESMLKHGGLGGAPESRDGGLGIGGGGGGSAERTTVAVRVPRNWKQIAAMVGFFVGAFIFVCGCVAASKGAIAACVLIGIALMAVSAVAYYRMWRAQGLVRQHAGGPPPLVVVTPDPNTPKPVVKPKPVEVTAELPTPRSMRSMLSHAICQESQEAIRNILRDAPNLDYSGISFTEIEQYKKDSVDYQVDKKEDASKQPWKKEDELTLFTPQTGSPVTCRPLCMVDLPKPHTSDEIKKANLFWDCCASATTWIVANKNHDKGGFIQAVPAKREMYVPLGYQNSEMRDVALLLKTGWTIETLMTIYRKYDDKHSTHRRDDLVTCLLNMATLSALDPLPAFMQGIPEDVLKKFNNLQ